MAVQDIFRREAVWRQYTRNVVKIVSAGVVASRGKAFAWGGTHGDGDIGFGVQSGQEG